MLLDKEENKREEGIVEYRNRVESVGVFIKRVWGFILANNNRVLFKFGIVVKFVFLIPSPARIRKSKLLD